MKINSITMQAHTCPNAKYSKSRILLEGERRQKEKRKKKKGKLILNKPECLERGISQVL